MSSHNVLIAESVGLPPTSLNDKPNPQEESFEDDHSSKTPGTQSNTKKRNKKRCLGIMQSPKPLDICKLKEDNKDRIKLGKKSLINSEEIISIKRTQSQYQNNDKTLDGEFQQRESPRLRSEQSLSILNGSQMDSMSPSTRLSSQRKKERKNRKKSLLSNQNSETLNQKNGRWSMMEHVKFLEALKFFGKNWKKVEDHVATRTSTQARSHAQKFFANIMKKNMTMEQFLENLSTQTIQELKATALKKSQGDKKDADNFDDEEEIDRIIMKEINQNANLNLDIQQHDLNNAEENSLVNKNMSNEQEELLSKKSDSVKDISKKKRPMRTRIMNLAIDSVQQEKDFKRTISCPNNQDYLNNPFQFKLNNADQNLPLLTQENLNNHDLKLNLSSKKHQIVQGGTFDQHNYHSMVTHNTNNYFSQKTPSFDQHNPNQQPQSIFDKGTLQFANYYPSAISDNYDEDHQGLLNEEINFDRFERQCPEQNNSLFQQQPNNQSMRQTLMNNLAPSQCNISSTMYHGESIVRSRCGSNFEIKDFFCNMNGERHQEEVSPINQIRLYTARSALFRASNNL